MTTEKRNIIIQKVLAAVLFFILGMIFGASIFSITVSAPVPEKSEIVTEVSTTEKAVEQETLTVKETTTLSESDDDIYILSDEDIRLIALVTMAEAEGECEEGKRLVIDTILNRVDSKRFPDTVRGVIYQPNQFTSMWNGRVNRCKATDDICQLVREELVSRTNSEVIFFRTDHYSEYGTPLFQVGSHYFSKY